MNRAPVVEPGSSWTNDGQEPVEMNPPGIIVQPGATIAVDENGNVKLTTAPKPGAEPKVEPKPEPPVVEDAPARTGRGRSHRDE